MEMFYRNKDMVRCLEVVFGAEEQVDIATQEYQIKMLEVNEIPYLLDVYVIRMNNEATLRYLTGKGYVFSKRFEHQHMDGTLFVQIMSQIGKCVKALSLYLLSVENLVLNPEYMFFDEEERCVKLVYVPGYRMNFKTQLKQLLEFMMRVFNSTDREGIQQLYKLYNELDETIWEDTTFNLFFETGEFEDDKIDKWNQNVVPIPSKISSQNRMNDKGDYPLARGISNYEDTSPENIRDKIKHLNLIQRGILGLNIALVLFSIFAYVFGGKNIFWIYFAAAFCVLFAIFSAYAFAEEQDSEDDAMEKFLRNRDVIASSASMSENSQCLTDNQIHALVPLTNGSLSEIVFRDYGEKIIVGRGKNETDYRLPTTEINRVHAYIYQKQGGIFLEDMESQNGTFLNSVRIPSNEIKKLNRGDIVGFASEEFFVS